MSDDLRHGTTSADHDDSGDKRLTARRLTEAAAEARAAGDEGRAAELLEQAERTDPEAVAEVMAEGGVTETAEAPLSDADADAEVAAISRTIEPGGAAPSRANITGSGSGADNA